MFHEEEKKKRERKITQNEFNKSGYVTCSYDIKAVSTDPNDISFGKYERFAFTFSGSTTFKTSFLLSSLAYARHACSFSLAHYYVS